MAFDEGAGALGEFRIQEAYELGRIGIGALGQDVEHPLCYLREQGHMPLGAGERIRLDHGDLRIPAAQADEFHLETAAAAFGIGKLHLHGLLRLRAPLIGTARLGICGRLSTEPAFGIVSIGLGRLERGKPGERLILAHMQPTGNLHRVVLRNERILDGGEHLQRIAECERTRFGAVQVVCRKPALDTVADQRGCGIKLGSQGIDAVFTHEIRGIQIVGQGAGAQVYALAPRFGIHGLIDKAQSTVGGTLPRFVSIEQVDDLLPRMAREDADVLSGERGSQGGDRIGHTRLMQGDHVGVAFDHQRHTGGSHRRLGTVESVEHARLMEERRLLAVEVLGFALPHHAAAEGDAVSLIVEDREHDAVEETVLRRLSLVPGHHVRVDHFLDRIPLRGKMRIQRFAPRGKTQLPRPGYRTAQSPAGKIGTRCIRFGGLSAHQLQMVEFAAFLAHFLQPRLIGTRCRIAPRLMDFDSRAVGKLAHGIGEIDVLGLHDVREDVAALMAAEAVEQLGGGVDLARRGPLFVEGAAAPEGAPLLAKGNAVGEHGYDIARFPDLPDVLVADSHGACPPSDAFPTLSTAILRRHALAGPKTPAVGNAHPLANRQASG